MAPRKKISRRFASYNGGTGDIGPGAGGSGYGLSGGWSGRGSPGIGGGGGCEGKGSDGVEAIIGETLMQGIFPFLRRIIPEYGHEETGCKTDDDFLSIVSI